MWKILKMIFNIDKFLKCGKQFRWAQNCSSCEKSVMRRKKFIKHQVQYHVLNTKKEWFLRAIISKHEQNVVKSGQNILPVRVRGVKMKWIVKNILGNTKRRYIYWIVVINKHRRFHVNWIYIIPSSREKVKWVVKDILWNTNTQACLNQKEVLGPNCRWVKNE